MTKKKWDKVNNARYMANQIQMVGRDSNAKPILKIQFIPFEVFVGPWYQIISGQFLLLIDIHEILSHGHPTRTWTMAMKWQYEWLGLGRSCFRVTCLNREGQGRTEVGMAGQGVEMRVFTLLTWSSWRTNQPMDGRTDKASYRVACPQLIIGYLPKTVYRFHLSLLDSWEKKWHAESGLWWLIRKSINWLLMWRFFSAWSKTYETDSSVKQKEV